MMDHLVQGWNGTVLVERGPPAQHGRARRATITHTTSRMVSPSRPAAGSGERAAATVEKAATARPVA